MQVTQQALDIGERIRKAYLGVGLNRNRFARLIDVNYTTIYNWERGVRMPSATNLEAIAETTGKSASWLLTGDETPGAEASPARTPAYIKAADKAWNEFVKSNASIVALFSAEELEEMKSIQFRTGAPTSPSFYLHIAMAMLDHRSGVDLIKALDATDITPEPDGTFKGAKIGG